MDGLSTNRIGSNVHIGWMLDWNYVNVAMCLSFLTSNRAAKRGDGGVN